MPPYADADYPEMISLVLITHIITTTVCGQKWIACNGKLCEDGQ